MFGLLSPVDRERLKHAAEQTRCKSDAPTTQTTEQPAAGVHMVCSIIDTATAACNYVCSIFIQQRVVKQRQSGRVAKKREWLEQLTSSSLSVKACPPGSQDLKTRKNHRR